MAQKQKQGNIDVGGLWSAPDSDNDGDKNQKAEAKDNNNALQGGRFELNLSKQKPVLATAAPGMR
jgi:hypothetical protein